MGDKLLRSMPTIFLYFKYQMYNSWRERYVWAILGIRCPTLNQKNIPIIGIMLIISQIAPFSNTKLQKNHLR